TNVTQAGFHSTIMDTYFAQLETMYNAGARSFLLLTVPPIERAPLFYVQGSSVRNGVSDAVKDYNKQLAQRAKKFMQTHRGSEAIIYDTSKVFNTLMNNDKELGYVNVTGYADPYANGTPTTTTQVAGYAPVSSYFWLNMAIRMIFTVTALTKSPDLPTWVQINDLERVVHLYKLFTLDSHYLALYITLNLSTRSR
ncbi:1914_t:CDS:2, partial [Acaulospora colombiana]